jgi:parallel beta-helix repeat protein
LDWGSQNARITGNLIIDRRDGIYIEVSFGPTIIDNNIFIRSGVRDWSDGNIYAHNLFYQSPMFHLMGVPRRPFVPYYKPHSTEQAGRDETKLRHERWYNNIFIGGNAKKIPQKVNDTSGFLVNNNVYLDGEPKFPFEGDKSIVDDLKSELEFQNNPETASIRFNLSELPLKGTYPLITSKMIGKMPLPQVFMENPDGTALDVTTDYFGNAIDPKNIKPGPFQEITAGANKFTVWPHHGRKDK